MIKSPNKLVLTMTFSDNDVLKNIAKFTGKHLYWNLFFNKVAGLPANSLKKRLHRRFFPVNFAKFLSTSISKNTCEQLLVNYWCCGTIHVKEFSCCDIFFKVLGYT